MSADAKAWKDGEGDWCQWHGIHDGDCLDPASHENGIELTALLASLERCLGGKPMRWETRVYPDGQVGLRGFTW